MLFDLPKEDSPIIKVIGVGGGGSNAVTHMYKQGIVGVDFAICNTDAQAMENSAVPTKIQLGPFLTDPNQTSARKPAKNPSRTCADTWKITAKCCSSPPAWAVVPALALHPSSPK
jgi:hypothetical protein